MTKRQSNWSSSQRHSTPQFIRNRQIVRQRDKGCCIRCLTLHGLFVGGRECDHFIPLSRGGTDELNNLIYLCRECHSEKTQRESNGLSGFTPTIGLDGWEQDEPDWLEIIAERNRNYFNNISF